jgi:hypothetical protein
MFDALGLITPGLFYSLAILACPVGMGAMMWLMMRGGRQGHQMSQSSNPTEPPIDFERETELARLRDEINELRSNLVEHGGDVSVDKK